MIDRRSLIEQMLIGGLSMVGPAVRGGTPHAKRAEGALLSLDRLTSPDEVTSAVMRAAQRGEAITLEPERVYHTRSGIVTRFPVQLFGKGILQVDQAAKSVLHVWGEAQQVDSLVIDGVIFAQPSSPLLSGGTRNNHFSLKLSGVSDARVSNVKFLGANSRGADLGLHVGYGEIGMADRASLDVAVSGVEGNCIRAIGFELFGSRNGNFRELSFVGDDGSDGFGLMAGVRMTSYDFARNLGNLIEGRVSHFHVGLSVQGYSYNNTAKLDISDCVIGIHVHGVTEKRGAVDVSRFNILHVVARRCGHAIYDGGSDNTFFVDAQDCGSHGILATGGRGAAGVGAGNSYSGNIRGFTRYGADIGGDRATVDLVITGRGRQVSAVGLRSTAAELRGNVKVSGVHTGVILEGADANISVEASDCQNALVIRGNGNTVRCNIEGPVIVSGRGNRLLGLIRGPVSLSGFNNRNDASA